MQTMKKVIAIILVLVLSMMVLTACGGSGGGSKGLTVKTLGDAFEAADDNGVTAWQYGESKFVYVFEKGGTVYRAIADMSEDVYAALEAIDFFSADRDEQIFKTAGVLEVQTFENLTEMIPSQEETDKFVGKTGAELFDDDWTYWYYDLETMEAGMSHGIFDYVVKFDYDGPQMENSDDFDFYEAFKDLVVKEITCDGIGDATDIE